MKLFSILSIIITLSVYGVGYLLFKSKDGWMIDAGLISILLMVFASLGLHFESSDESDD
ncbi:hypothetical protein [Succinivibrio dextrinosolvens]|uniref:hypothetical protein n=1 Tax=Succinivibrio dextrinosolvens TaxID=83771 RepID=UPI00241DC464|nr:hypothetical protein [Succinivibrio dextrinosolvens]